VQSKSYDCVIMDLKMPGMDGQMLYRRIEEFDRQLAEKVIFISGDTASADTRNIVANVPNPVLSKPFSPADLRQRVRKLLEEPVSTEQRPRPSK